MPYINEIAREVVDDEVDALIAKLEGHTGAVFNYVISRLAGARVLEQAKQRAEGEYLIEISGADVGTTEILAEQEAARDNTTTASYQDRAETLGHLQACVREFERRVLNQYEVGALARAFGDGAGDIPEYAAL